MSSDADSKAASSTTDPRIPARDACVTRYLIDRWDREMPDKEFAVFQDGESWSYRELREKVVRLAGGLAGEGVEQGDHVAVWMFDSKEAILVFFAINYLGAVFVPFNTAYKGKVLLVVNVASTEPPRDARHRRPRRGVGRGEDALHRERPSRAAHAADPDPGPDRGALVRRVR